MHLSRDTRERALSLLEISCRPISKGNHIGLGARKHWGLFNSVAAISIELEDEPELEGAGTPAGVPGSHVRNDSVAGKFLGGVGCLRNHPYVITLDGEARAHAIATPRRVPFPLHDKVNDELARMQKLGYTNEGDGAHGLG